MIELKEARRILGANGESMTDQQIERLRASLYALTGQMLDNHLGRRALCKTKRKQ